MADITTANIASPDTRLDGRIHSLREDKSRVATSAYAIAAATTLFIYDILLTLSDEIELVWYRSMWTFPTLLYLANRYIALSCLLLACYEMSPFRPSLNKESFTTIGFCIGMASWGGIMSLRATALWRANKPLVWVIWFSWACMVVTVTVCTVFTYFDQLPTVLFDPILGICTSSGATRIQFVLPALQASFVLGVTILTVLKAYQYPSPLRRLRDMSSIMRLLLRDGMVYFVVVTILSIASGISWSFLPSLTVTNKTSIFIYLNWSIFSAIIARLFLRLRKIFYGPAMESLQSPISYYSTTPQWNILPMGQVAEDEDSRFFRDDEFGMLSMFDTTIESASFILPSLEVRSTSLHPLSRVGTIAESMVIPRTRPTTGTSTRSHSGQSARPPTTCSNRTRPPTGSETMSNTAPSLHTLNARKTTD